MAVNAAELSCSSIAGKAFLLCCFRVDDDFFKGDRPGIIERLLLR